MISSTFDQCKEELVLASENLLKIEQLETNAEMYIFDYFEDLKIKVDLRREDLKFKIDNYSEELIKSIEINQRNCTRMSREVNRISANIERSKKELNELMDMFQTAEFNDNKRFDEIKASAKVVNKDFFRTIAAYHNFVIGGKEYKFEFEDSSIETIFGSLTDLEVSRHFDSAVFDFDSTILDEQNKVVISQLCNFSLAKEWQLKYRATRDGFGAQDFHGKCDGIKKTLTIVKSTNGNIFGGFTEKGWDSSSGWPGDSKAYIFSVTNQENRPFKVLCSDAKHAIYCHSDYGPTFGYYHDIYIASNSNNNQRSRSHLGATYQHADYKEGTERAKAILAGSYCFQAIEIEVFAETS